MNYGTGFPIADGNRRLQYMGARYIPVGHKCMARN